jgi:hypothetical protein
MLKNYWHSGPVEVILSSVWRPDSAARRDKMTVMTATTQPPGEHLEFEQHAKLILGRLRSAMSAVLTAIPCTGAGRTPIRKAADLQKALGIHYKLAWQMHRVATARDPLAESGNVPGETAMKRFFHAAADRGVPDKLIREAHEALRAFEELIHRHAEDRTSFDSMVGGLANDEIDLNQRRAAFKANSQLWGVQARTQLFCSIVNWSAQPDRVDLVTLRGLIDLRWLRSPTTWPISRSRMVDDDGRVRASTNSQPLDADGLLSHGIGLLREFCSQPIPKIQTVQGPSGLVSSEVVGDSIGSRSAVTCFVGEVRRACGTRFRDQHNRYGRLTTKIRTPVEVLVHDVIVPQGLFGTSLPTARVFSDLLAGDSVAEGRDADIMSIREPVSFMGKGPHILQTTDVPRYVEMGQYAFDRVGWNSDDFDVYRYRLEYPVMPTSVVLQFDLPEPPGK